MRAAVIVLILCSCTRSRQQHESKARATIGSGSAECIYHDSKYGDIAFCVDGNRISVCTDVGCIVTSGECK